MRPLGVPSILLTFCIGPLMCVLLTIAMQIWDWTGERRPQSCAAFYVNARVKLVPIAERLHQVNKFDRVLIE